MAQGQQLLLPIYLNQKARAGDCTAHVVRGQRTHGRALGLGTIAPDVPVRPCPFLWVPFGVQAHPTSILLIPVRSFSLYSPSSPAGTALSHSPHPAFPSPPNLLPGCISSPAWVPLWRRGAATSLLCSKGFKGSGDLPIKDSKQRENVFSPQVHFIPVTKNPKERETKPEQPLHGHGERVESSLSCHRVNLHLSTTTFILLANPFFPKFLLAQEGWRKSELL